MPLPFPIPNPPPTTHHPRLPVLRPAHPSFSAGGSDPGRVGGCFSASASGRPPSIFSFHIPHSALRICLAGDASDVALPDPRIPKPASTYHFATTVYVSPPLALNLTLCPSWLHATSFPASSFTAYRPAACRIVHSLSFAATIFASLSLPSRHARSTVHPPRALSPVTSPSAQASGSAGRRCNSSR